MNQPNSTFTIDIAAINKAERERYLREEAPKRNLSEWFGLFTPWAICLVFVAFYAQSAQHTSYVLDQLAPGVGWAAPIGVEAGLIYLAFRQRQLAALQPKREMVLRWLLFLTAVLTNFAGALFDVTATSKLTGKSAGDILSTFAALPAPTQAALLMVVIMAFIVPIVCEVAGHGIADLVFTEKRNAYREEHWKRVEIKVTFQAVYNIYIQAGTPPHDAQAIATTQVRGYFGKLDIDELLIAPSQRAALYPGVPETVETPPAVRKALAWLKEHPETEGQSVRAVAAQAGMTPATIHRAKQEQKKL